MFILGDVPVDDTLYLPFDTFDSDGASVTITGLAVTDIEIYKDGSVTQRASDNGYALLDTDGIDFDGAVGLHGFSVDLSDNSDAGFYAAGSTYWIHVNAITVDSQTVRFTYHFTIGKLLRPATAGRTLDVTAGGTAGIDWANVESPSTAVDLSGTDIQLCDTTTTNTDMVSEPLDAAGIRTAVGIASANIDTQLAALPTAVEIQAEMEENGASVLDTIRDLLVADGTIDQLLDDIKAVTDALPDFTGMTSLPEWLGALAGKQAANSTAKTEMRATGAGSGTYNEQSDSLQADHDNSVTVYTSLISGQSTIITHLTDVKGTNFAKNTDSLVKLAHTGADSDTLETLSDQIDGIEALLPGELVSGRMSSDVVAISGSTDAADKLEASAETMVIGAAEAGTLSTTQMTSDLAEATNDHYNGRVIIWTSGVLLGQATDITDYAGANGLLTFTAVTEPPSAADTFVIV